MKRPPPRAGGPDPEPWRDLIKFPDLTDWTGKAVRELDVNRLPDRLRGPAADLLRSIAARRGVSYPRLVIDPSIPPGVVEVRNQDGSIADIIDIRDVPPGGGDS